MDGEANGEAGEAGRVRSDFHSGGGPGARFRPY
jgi:nucleotide-sensitive chloride channel 1A